MMLVRMLTDFTKFICLSTGPLSMVSFLFTFMIVLIQNCVVFVKIMKFSKKFCRNFEKVLWKFWNIFVKIMTNFWKFIEKFVEILKVEIMRNFRENFAKKVL